MLLNAIPLSALAAILQNAVMAGREFAAATPEGHWYPCGFAWISAPKTRKNSKEGKVLEANGFKWDDYAKRYQIWAGTFTSSQSMDYKEAICRHVVTKLKEAGLDGFYVGTRID